MLPATAMPFFMSVTFRNEGTCKLFQEEESACKRGDIGGEKE